MTSGLLRRRSVAVAGVTHIGKEANRIDEVAAGLVLGNEGYAVFEDQWELVRSVLQQVPEAILLDLTKRSRSAAMDLSAGRSRSSHAHRLKIVAEVGNWCRAELNLRVANIEAIAAWLAAPTTTRRGHRL